MRCEKDSLYMTNSVNNGQNALDGIVWSKLAQMLRKIAIYSIHCLIQSLKVVMIWQKDNPEQTFLKESLICAVTICHLNITF